jgi:hypothetical protein
MRINPTQQLNGASTRRGGREGPVRPQQVAMAFSKSCKPMSLGDNVCAVMPEPTTMLTNRAVPRNSADNFLTRSKEVEGGVVTGTGAGE